MTGFAHSQTTNKLVNEAANDSAHLQAWKKIIVHILAWDHKTIKKIQQNRSFSPPMVDHSRKQPLEEKALSTSVDSNSQSDLVALF